MKRAGKCLTKKRKIEIRERLKYQICLIKSNKRSI